jgi:hypothetical protein
VRVVENCIVFTQEFIEQNSAYNTWCYCDTGVVGPVRLDCVVSSGFSPCVKTLCCKRGVSPSLSVMNCVRAACLVPFVCGSVSQTCLRVISAVLVSGREKFCWFKNHTHTQIEKYTCLCLVCVSLQLTNRENKLLHYVLTGLFCE